MAKKVDEYEKEVIKALKAHNLYTASLKKRPYGKLPGTAKSWRRTQSSKSRKKPRNLLPGK